MEKLWIGALIGAICGAGLTAVLVTRPFESSIINILPGANPGNSASYRSQTSREQRLVEDVHQDQLQELQTLLMDLQNEQWFSRKIRGRLQQVLSTLVWVDPVATAELIANFPSRHEETVRLQFLRLWVASDGAALVHTLPVTWRDTFPELYNSLIGLLAVSEPKLMLPHILAMPAGLQRARLMASLPHGLSVEEIPRYLDALSQLTEGERHNILRWDTGKLANIAPQLLFDWSHTLNEPQQKLAAQQALIALARLDPKTALSLIEGYSTSKRLEIVSTALRRLAQTELQVAVAEAEARGRFFVEVANVWANDDPAAAVLWLVEQTQEDRRLAHDPLFGSILSNWAKRDLDAALAFTEMLPQQQRGGWSNAIAAHLSRRDPDRLETIALTLSDTPYAGDMFARLAQVRYGTDPAGTMQQILSLEPSTRDRPLGLLVTHLMRDTPELAAPLIGQITDRSARANALGRVLGEWQGADDGAMEQWLASEASPSLRNEAYATLALEQPELLSSIEDRELRVATYLKIRRSSRTTSGIQSLLEEIDLTDPQWEALNSAALAAARAGD